MRRREAEETLSFVVVPVEAGERVVGAWDEDTAVDGAVDEDVTAPCVCVDDAVDEDAVGKVAVVPCVCVEDAVVPCVCVDNAVGEDVVVPCAEDAEDEAGPCVDDDVVGDDVAPLMPDVEAVGEEVVEEEDEEVIQEGEVVLEGVR